MQPTFNLIDKPWIPCVNSRGQPVEKSLRQVLTQAGELKNLSPPSPLSLVALLRLLLAVLYRATGPLNARTIRQFYQEGLPRDKINAYLEEWHDRFDLFSPDYPFYQVAGLELNTKAISSVDRFNFEIAGGNNRTLFDHTVDGTAKPLRPAEVALRLITGQTFCLASPQSPPGSTGDGVNLKRCSYRQSPAVAGVNAWPVDENLEKTLILALAPEPNHQIDSAAWEREGPAETHERSMPAGVADLYTWQSRYVLLSPVEVDRELMASEKILYCHGRTVGEGFDDPMKCRYFKNRKEGLKLLYYNQSKATWRNMPSLVGAGDHKKPATVDNLKSLKKYRIVSGNHPVTLVVAGVLNDQAKVVTWYQDHIPAPSAIFAEPELAALVEEAIGDAERRSATLRKRCWRMFETYLSKDQSDPDPDDIRNMLQSFAPMDRYWGSLESGFYSFIADLPERGTEARRQWQQRLDRAAQKALEHVASQLGQGTRAIVARAQISSFFSFEKEFENERKRQEETTQ